MIPYITLKAIRRGTLSPVLLIALVMFPQIVETIYSPALPLIAERFNVSQIVATQTLSCYFLAFALGVMVWGILCDLIGRRLSVLLALLLYTLATLIALLAPSFSMLLLARIAMAFSAAIGSIGTQTMIRDQLSGDALRKLFSVIGIVLALSPMIGLILGAFMSSLGGVEAIFSLLSLIGVILLCWCMFSLPETKVQPPSMPKIMPLLGSMIRSRHIWRCALLIASFNIMLFSYYQLAPFMFERLDLPRSLYGFSGIFLGVGTFIGAYSNQYLIKRSINGDRLILLAIGLSLLSSLLVKGLESKSIFVLPMMGIMIAYSIAIPNLLTIALKDYQHALGSAGAILGLLYYALIGLGLILAGMTSSLGLVLIPLSLMAFLIFKL